MSAIYLDYLEHYNHNHDRLGRFARSTGAAASSIGGKVSGKKKNKQAPKADIKKGKSANTKLSESERNRIVKSGSAKEVNKHKSQLSNRELKSAVDRLMQEKTDRNLLESQLSSLTASPKKQGQMRKAIDWMDKHQKDVETLKKFTGTGIDLYNNVAKINNSLAGSNMPIIKENYKKPQHFQQISNGPKDKRTKKVRKPSK